MIEAGLFLPQVSLSFPAIEERVRTAEEAGFASAWLIDHLAPPGAPDRDLLEAWTTVAALAVRTTTIRLGHLVVCNPFRHPVVLAKSVATVDHLSGGRLDLGIGWGSVPAELRAYGFPDESPAVRAARLGETLEILDRLFTGEAVDHDGRFWTLSGALTRPRPVAGRVPIHLGGAGPKLTMPLVARWADWWNCPSYGVDRLDELRPLAGGRARVSVQHPIGLAPSARAREEVESRARRRFGTWGGLVTGTPEELVAALAPEVRAGVELIVCQFSDFGDPATIELFAREVLPALRELAA